MAGSWPAPTPRPPFETPALAQPPRPHPSPTPSGENGGNHPFLRFGSERSGVQPRTAESSFRVLCQGTTSRATPPTPSPICPLLQGHTWGWGHVAASPASQLHKPPQQAHRLHVSLESPSLSFRWPPSQTLLLLHLPDPTQPRGRFLLHHPKCPRSAPPELTLTTGTLITPSLLALAAPCLCCGQFYNPHASGHEGWSQPPGLRPQLCHFGAV